MAQGKIMSDETITFNGWKMFEKILIRGFKHFGIIPNDFTGNLTLHINDGNLCEIDRFERGLRKRVVK